MWKKNTITASPIRIRSEADSLALVLVRSLYIHPGGEPYCESQNFAPLSSPGANIFRPRTATIQELARHNPTRTAARSRRQWIISRKDRACIYEYGS